MDNKAFGILLLLVIHLMFWTIILKYCTFKLFIVIKYLILYNLTVHMFV